jgi:hypothetical protein
VTDGAAASHEVGLHAMQTFKLFVSSPADGMVERRQRSLEGLIMLRRITEETDDFGEIGQRGHLEASHPYEMKANFALN